MMMSDDDPGTGNAERPITSAGQQLMSTAKIGTSSSRLRAPKARALMKRDDAVGSSEHGGGQGDGNRNPEGAENSENVKPLSQSFLDITAEQTSRAASASAIEALCGVGRPRSASAATALPSMLKLGIVSSSASSTARSHSTEMLPAPAAVSGRSGVAVVRSSTTTTAASNRQLTSRLAAGTCQTPAAATSGEQRSARAKANSFDNHSSSSSTLRRGGSEKTSRFPLKVRTTDKVPSTQTASNSTMTPTAVQRSASRHRIPIVRGAVHTTGSAEGGPRATSRSVDQKTKCTGNSAMQTSAGRVRGAKSGRGAKIGGTAVAGSAARMGMVVGPNKAAAMERALLVKLREEVAALEADVKAREEARQQLEGKSQTASETLALKKRLGGELDGILTSGMLRTKDLEEVMEIKVAELKREQEEVDDATRQAESAMVQTSREILSTEQKLVNLKAEVSRHVAFLDAAHRQRDEARLARESLVISCKNSISRIRDAEANLQADHRIIERLALQMQNARANKYGASLKVLCTLHRQHPPPRAAIRLNLEAPAKFVPPKPKVENQSPDLAHNANEGPVGGLPDALHVSLPPAGNAPESRPPLAAVRTASGEDSRNDPSSGPDGDDDSNSNLHGEWLCTTGDTVQTVVLRPGKTRRNKVTADKVMTSSSASAARPVGGGKFSREEEPAIDATRVLKFDYVADADRAGQPASLMLTNWGDVENQLLSFWNRYQGLPIEIIHPSTPLEKEESWNYELNEMTAVTRNAVKSVASAFAERQAFCYVNVGPDNAHSRQKFWGASATRKIMTSPLFAERGDPVNVKMPNVEVPGGEKKMNSCESESTTEHSATGPSATGILQKSVEAAFCILSAAAVGGSGGFTCKATVLATVARGGGSSSDDAGDDQRTVTEGTDIVDAIDTAGADLRDQGGVPPRQRRRSELVEALCLNLGSMALPGLKGIPSDEEGGENEITYDSDCGRVEAGSSSGSGRPATDPKNDENNSNLRQSSGFRGWQSSTSSVKSHHESTTRSNWTNRSNSGGLSREAAHSATGDERDRTTTRQGWQEGQTIGGVCGSTRSELPRGDKARKSSSLRDWRTRTVQGWSTPRPVTSSAEVIAGIRAAVMKLDPTFFSSNKNPSSSSSSSSQEEDAAMEAQLNVITVGASVGSQVATRRSPFHVAVRLEISADSPASLSAIQLSAQAAASEHSSQSGYSSANPFAASTTTAGSSHMMQTTSVLSTSAASRLGVTHSAAVNHFKQHPSRREASAATRSKGNSGGLAGRAPSDLLVADLTFVDLCVDPSASESPGGSDFNFLGDDLDLSETFELLASLREPVANLICSAAAPAHAASATCDTSKASKQQGKAKTATASSIAHPETLHSPIGRLLASALRNRKVSSKLATLLVSSSTPQTASAVRNVLCLASALTLPPTTTSAGRSAGT